MCIRVESGLTHEANLLAMVTVYVYTHTCACTRTQGPRGQFTDIDHGYIESETNRDGMGWDDVRGAMRTSASKSERGSLSPQPLPLPPRAAGRGGQRGTCAAAEQRYTRRPYPGQANSSVAARIINLFPWQPRRDPHHWLRRFSHPRAITFYGRTANYRCRDTLHRSQRKIDRRGL